MGKHVARRDTHIRVYANARQLSIFRVHCAVQPPIGFELMRILSPDVFVTVIGRPAIHPKCVYGTENLPIVRGKRNYNLCACWNKNFVDQFSGCCENRFGKREDVILAGYSQGLTFHRMEP